MTNKKKKCTKSNKKETWYKSEEYKIYSKMPDKYTISQQEWLEKNEIPNWEEVEQYGGEGQGDTWYSVKYFPNHNIYIRVDGFYQSHYGTDFSGWDCLTEVTPKQKTITVYE